MPTKTSSIILRYLTTYAFTIWLSIFTPIATANELAPASKETSTSVATAKVPIKSLKYLAVAADVKLWSLKADSADNLGANVDLEFATDDNLTVSLFEDHRNTKLANTFLTLSAVVKDISKSIPGVIKVTNVPSHFTPPNDAKCTAFPVSGADRIVLTNIVCVIQKSDWHGGVMIAYNNSLKPQQISALNLLMGSIRTTDNKTKAK